MNEPHRYLLACLALAGCTRPGLAPWVPKLELRLVSTRASELSAGAHSARGTELTASLRWQPLLLARALPYRFELEEVTHALAPCELDAEDCLLELAESERTLAPIASELP